MCILDKAPEKRTKLDITILDDYFREFPFFKKLQTETDAETCTSCYKLIRLKRYLKKETVFNYGNGIDK